MRAGVPEMVGVGIIGRASVWNTERVCVGVKGSVTVEAEITGTVIIRSEITEKVCVGVIGKVLFGLRLQGTLLLELRLQRVLAL